MIKMDIPHRVIPDEATSKTNLIQFVYESFSLRVRTNFTKKTSYQPGQDLSQGTTLMTDFDCSLYICVSILAFDWLVPTSAILNSQNNSISINCFTIFHENRSFTVLIFSFKEQKQAFFFSIPFSILQYFAILI